MRRFILSTVVLTALAAAGPALAGKSITVLLPSPQDANIAADFEKETGIHVDLQTLSWDDIRPKLVTALLAGTAPADVTEFDWSWTGQFDAAGWYLPLNDAIDADTVADIAVASIFTIDGQAPRRSLHQRLPRHAGEQEAFRRCGHHHDADDARRTRSPTPSRSRPRASSSTRSACRSPPTEGASTSWYLLTKAFGGDLFDKDFKPAVHRARIPPATRRWPSRSSC